MVWLVSIKKKVLMKYIFRKGVEIIKAWKPIYELVTRQPLLQIMKCRMFDPKPYEPMRIAKGYYFWWNINENTIKVIQQ